ncbi:MAG: ammonium transporter [Betaproteobacteria bacterium]|mgnify:FL=1|jgi:Amt family ammonium transporter|nr:ammonium transporter [Burkholderiales bacterium]MBT5950822.1 ammonium transporter [Betaproteobacteria bacterium]MDA0360582.1 ammonium transporter [Pseudomonadota bacterium]MBL6879110.1 ammonium transporter [Burkholderiales bacterium]MBT6411090.1 ammonium transporter [Betaproteobacteria bacterium]
MLKKLLFWAAALGLSAVSGPSFAEDTLSAGDTSWMIVATVLVIMMSIPGLALFYGGLVRTKNMLSVLMQVFAIVALMSILWAIAGYSLAFTEGPFNSIIGGFDKAFLAGITPDTLSGTIPEYVFVTFQLTFACITPALIIGAFAERIKFSAVLWFSALWLFVSYIPICHMVWGGGYLGSKGALDFAGGTVVHINAAIAGLVICLVLGKRLGYGKEAMPPHNLPFTMVGAALLWVGWFGFNVGSELAADGTAGLVLLTTQLCTAASVLGWLFIEWITRGKPTMLGGASGAVAGLVAITPACAFVGPMGAIVLGAITGVVCFFACTKIKSAFGYDDSLDVFGVHGIGGIIGAIGAGILCAPGFGGVGYGEGVTMGSQVAIQIEGVVITILWSGIASLILIKIVDGIVGIRPTEDEEREGLDATSHGEAAYHN